MRDLKIMTLVTVLLLFVSSCGKVEITNPVIDGFTPTRGPAGTRVTIAGKRFADTPAGNAVSLNGVPAEVVSATTTQLVVVVPAGATTGQFAVTTSGGLGSNSASFVVTRLVGGSVQGVRLSLAGSVSTVAGFAGVAGSSDGSAGSALFSRPYGLAADTTTLYITDRGNHTIRTMDIATGLVTTIAGAPGVSGSTDGVGSAARFNSPAGVTILGGKLYICDSGNHTVRQIDLATRQVTTLAGSPGIAGAADSVGSGTALGASARFNAPAGITTDGSFLYLCDSGNQTVRRVDPTTGSVVTVAGLAGVTGSADSPIRFNNPTGIASDGARLFIFDSNNQTLRVFDIASGRIVTVAGFPGLIGSSGGRGGAVRFNFPTGITTDGGVLYLTDTVNHTVRTFAPDSGLFSTGVVGPLAGAAGTPGNVDGTGSGALFSGPTGITTDGTSLFVADTENHTIRMIR